MPATLLGHASQTTPLLANKPRDMEERKKDIVVCPTDHETIAPKSEQAPQQTKQSLDYVWRTGLAGGLAGCAVHNAIDLSQE